MPLLYGEGPKAFVRLQEEIIKVSNDHTIFCWTWNSSVPQDWVSMLAPSPEVFQLSSSFERTLTGKAISTFSMTNAGLSIRLPIIQSWSYYFVVLNAQYSCHSPDQRACIPLKGLLDSPESGNNRLLQRLPFPANPVFLYVDWAIVEKNIFAQSRLNSFQVIPAPRNKSFCYGLLFTLGNSKALLDKRISSVSQFDSGGGIFLIEKTKGVIPLETYPPGLFDLERSMFLFHHRIQDAIHGGLLRLDNQTTGLVIFFAIKFLPSDDVLWFTRMLHSTSWGTQEPQRRNLLKSLVEKVTPQTEDERIHASSSLEASIMISNRIESISGDKVRVAYLNFGDYLRNMNTQWRMLNHQYDGDEEAGSDTDSHVPAIVHRPRVNIQNAFNV